MFHRQALEDGFFIRKMAQTLMNKAQAAIDLNCRKVLVSGNRWGRMVPGLPVFLFSWKRRSQPINH